MSTSWAVIAVELTSDILLKIGQINPIISSSRLRCLKGKHCRLKRLQLQVPVCPLASPATENPGDGTLVCGEGEWCECSGFSADRGLKGITLICLGRRWEIQQWAEESSNVDVVT